MHEAQWHGIAKAFRALLAYKDFRVTGELKWRYFSPSNKDADNSVAHLDGKLRARLKEGIFRIITGRKSLKIIACVTKVDEAFKLAYVNDADDLYAYSYKVLTERFQYFLQDTSRTVGDKQLGIVVADARGKKQDELLRKQHSGLVMRAGMFSSTYANYIETVFLTPSHYSVGIQLADMVAGAIGRHYNTGDSHCFNLIAPSIRASAAGKIEGFGLAKFPH
jgi:hypothetical protein